MPIGDFDPDDDQRSILTQIVFNRIILDEGHVIRNPKAAASLAVCRLRAKRRWVVTETPIHNSRRDMYSLIRFLQFSPFDQLEVFFY